MSANFEAAIQKMVKSPISEVFESAMEMFQSIQKMKADEVVAFWHALLLFSALSGGIRPHPSIQQMMDVAKERMQIIRGSSGFSDEPTGHIDAILRN